jgi:hypothetical protein
MVDDNPELPPNQAAHANAAAVSLTAKSTLFLRFEP